MKLKALFCALSMAACVPAFAAGGSTPVAGSQITQLFNITANVNTMLQLTALDGSPLSPDVSMNYNLLKGTLESADVQALLVTNDPTKDIGASILASPVLFSGNNTIPLTVKLNNKTLSATEQPLSAATLFNGGKAGDVDFDFAPTDPTANIAQGSYKGTVTVYLEQLTPSKT